MCCAPRLERRLRAAMPRSRWSNPENCMLYTPLPPGRRRAWSNPATWSCRCGGCCAPRQRVGTVTEYRPGLEDLYLPAAEQRRAGAQLGPPGGRSRVGQPPGSCPGPGRARLQICQPGAATSGRAGLGGRYRHARAIVELGSLGCTGGCQGRGALVEPTGLPPTQVGRLPTRTRSTGDRSRSGDHRRGPAPGRGCRPRSAGRAGRGRRCRPGDRVGGIA
jgi:hypothetical protein